MSGFSRLTIAGALIAGFASAASAQSHSARTSMPDSYALFEGRSASVESRTTNSAPVPPSESDTVMGLRVPR